MRWLEKMNDNIRRGVRSWLQIQPASPYNIQITEMMDFETHAIRDRIWYRGDSNELEQLYGNLIEYAVNTSSGQADVHQEWRSEDHTGLPGLIVRTLTAITLVDMNVFDFDNKKQGQIWSEIEKKNKFRKKIEKALKEVLYIGDGAFKVTIDTEVSEYPILEWYPGERVEIIRQHDRAQEVIFKTPYDIRGQRYVLKRTLWLRLYRE